MRNYKFKGFLLFMSFLISLNLYFSAVLFLLNQAFVLGEKTHT